MALLLIALVATPILELYLLIEIGSVIGAPWTIVAVLATAVIGAALIRRQGMGVYREAQLAMNRQELPLKQLFDGFFLLIAGAMLLTPGFVTDSIGFMLLVPPLRALIGWRIWQWMQARGSVRVNVNLGGGTVDGTYRDVSDQDDDGPDGKSGGPQILPPASDSRWGRNGNGQ